MIKLFSIIAFINLTLLVPLSWAESDLSDLYDENTEITISGTVINYALPKRGPVILNINFGKKVYYVVTAPPWFLIQNEIRFVAGSTVEVKGSKYYSRDGNIYVIAKMIRINQDGKKIILRDPNLKPLWGRHGWQRNKE
ncbi:MAG: hypothetical protein N3A59_07795 [Thermodesulfovibrionales bacterium]|nr:hypothetical protein [Thermodesulfovibrionales bacterium]